jgi:CDGSH-type Zn-finger protein
MATNENSGEQAATPQVTINVEADGPLAVSGPVRVVGADGSVLDEAERVWLCRCGNSAKKPFCDGSHRKVGFSDPGTGPTA